MVTDHTTDRRVLRVITRLNVGGPARQALLLSHALAPRYETVLVAGKPAATEGELDDPRVPVTYRSLVRPPRPAQDLRGFVQLVALIRRFRPDIVHTHMAKAGTLGRLAALASRPRPRVVHTFHGHVLEGYFRPAVTRAIIMTERKLARAADRLIAVSPEVRDELLALGIGEPPQFRVIPLGLDLRRHRAIPGPTGALRERLRLGDEEPLVGIAGRLVPIKDHPTLFEAIARLDGVHLAVLGDGEERVALQDHAQRLGIAARVHFVGWWLDMPSALADLDIVALSSRNEGTPVALIEAAACGRPVVATDVGGVRSVVTDGVHGLVVPPGDPTAFAAALSTLLEDREMRTTMGARGRVDSVRFDAERLIADIAALYEELSIRSG